MLWITGRGFFFPAIFMDSYRSSEVIRSLERARKYAEKLCGFLTSQIILATDNGSSFISRRFQEHLRLSKIEGSDSWFFRHMRIGYRMPIQLGLSERLHRTLKEEEIWPA
jgi:transposase InsO family protein